MNDSKNHIRNRLDVPAISLQISCVGRTWCLRVIIAAAQPAMVYPRVRGATNQYSAWHRHQSGISDYGTLRQRATLSTV